MTRLGFLLLVASVFFTVLTGSNVGLAQTKKTGSAAKYLKPGDKPYATDQAPKAMRTAHEEVSMLTRMAYRLIPTRSASEGRDRR